MATYKQQQQQQPSTDGFKYATIEIASDESLPTTCNKRIIIEIDNSDSMKMTCSVDQTRLQKVTDTVMKIITYLFRSEYDLSNIWVGVNSYNDQHKVLIEPVQVTGLTAPQKEETLQTFSDVLGSIVPNGMTNIETPVKRFVQMTQATRQERSSCLQMIQDIKASLYQESLTPAELCVLGDQLKSTSQQLEALPEFEDYLILLTDGQITRGALEDAIVDRYISRVVDDPTTSIYFIGFAKEHSASGLNKMDCRTGNYFGVINGAEGTAIAAAEIIFRIANPGIHRNIVLSIHSGGAQIYDALLNQWVPQISMGLFTPGKSIEFYTRIPADEDEASVELKYGQMQNQQQPQNSIIIRMDGTLTPNQSEYGMLRLESLQLMAEIKRHNEMYESIDYLTTPKRTVFKGLFAKTNQLIQKIELSDQSTTPEMLDLFNDVKMCQLTMGGYSSTSLMYNIGRLNAQWFGTCMRNSNVDAADITSHLYDGTHHDAMQAPTEPAFLGRAISDSTPRCISDCMATLSQQQQQPMDEDFDIESQASATFPPQATIAKRC